MKVTAGGPPISVSVVVVDPSAAVSHVDPAVAVTRVVPVVDLAYIEIVFSAYMDDSGRYQFKADTFAVVDQTALNTSKALSGDSISFSDATALTAAPVYADAFGLSDAITTVLIFLRDFTETLTVPDAKALVVSPTYVENLAPTDTIAFSHSKAFADGFAMNDMADAGGPVWSFSDTTANIITMSDSSLLSNDKGVSDSVSMADSGSAYAQNYVDPTYLAEDYVGVSVTF
jgi:hypothetical protein